MTWQQIGFLAVVFLSNIIQCVTGFAGTVLAMPFSVMLVGIGTARPILNIMGIAASVGVVVKNYKAIDRKEFLTILGVTLPCFNSVAVLLPMLFPRIVIALRGALQSSKH